jgi:hypothetical protein
MRCLSLICTLLMLTVAMLVSTAAGQDCCGVGCHLLHLRWGTALRQPDHR